MIEPLIDASRVGEIFVDSLYQEALPDEFHTGKGGGWSFLDACNDRNGAQWTSLHRTMDQLVCLGHAIGAVSFCLPREMWKILPGGMPYFVVDVGKMAEEKSP